MSQLFRHDISSGEFQLEISPFRKILRVSPQIDMRILVVGPYIKLCNSKGATQLKMTRDMVFEDDCHLGFTSILDSSFHLLRANHANLLGPSAQKKLEPFPLTISRKNSLCSNPIFFDQTRNSFESSNVQFQDIRTIIEANDSKTNT